METILEVRHLSKSIKTPEANLPILTDIQLSVQKGESIAILGASGTGKTTLLNLLAGLDLPDQGEIIFNHQSITTLTEEQRAYIRLYEIGFIFQSFELLPSLTAIENIMLPLEIQNSSQKIAKQKALEWLVKTGLSERANHYPSQLSGGEQQRVAIARAFITSPQIIYADEMTGNLDQHTGEKMIELLFNLNQTEKTTIILVTHDKELAHHCDKKYKLHQGRLILL